MLSDPLKLLVMFDLLGQEGVEFDRLRYYTFILKERKGVPFKYRFYWTSGPFSRRLEGDVNNLAAAELIETASPLKISEFGKTALRELSALLGGKTEVFKEEIEPYLQELESYDMKALQDEACMCLTER